MVPEATGTHFVSPGVKRQDSTTVHFRGSRYRSTVRFMASLLESNNNWLIFYIKYSKDCFS